MKSYKLFTLYFLITLFLGSCEFNCSIGDKKPTGKVEEKEGAFVYNDIKVNTFKAHLKRAYLVFEDGTRVPDDNFIDFTKAVELILDTEGGWVEENNKVFLGASEQIIDEPGNVLLNAEDLFSAYTTSGISSTDAKRIRIKASIKLQPNAPPTSFSVQFKVWDKKGDGFIEGSYLLFSK